MRTKDAKAACGYRKNDMDPLQLWCCKCIHSREIRCRTRCYKHLMAVSFFGTCKDHEAGNPEGKP